MFESIKKCCNDIKRNPRITLIMSMTMIGCVIGEIIAIQTEPGLMGFAAMGGAALSAGLTAISIFLCCPPPPETSYININSAPLKIDIESEAPAALALNANTLPTHNTGTSYVGVSFLETEEVKSAHQNGKAFSIN